jgi:hypothetical protein
VAVHASGDEAAPDVRVVTQVAAKRIVSVRAAPRLCFSPWLPRKSENIVRFL